MIAKPCKLRNGTWGAKIEGGTVRKGDTITVRTAAGKTWTATVEQVVWSGAGVTIVATSSSGAGSSTSSRGAGRSCCRGCRGPIVDAPHHRAMGGYCGSCAFDEFDC